LALWIELLYRTADRRDMPLRWAASLEKAEKHLESLKDPRMGLYRVSKLNHAALFMDNVEVYSSLNGVAKVQTAKDPESARRTAQKAEALAENIRRTFWDNDKRWFRASLQSRTPAFYPDAVAQTYPWLVGLPNPTVDPSQEWQRWKSQFGEAWLANTYDPHAWGLVALASAHVGDPRTADCWLSRASSLRAGAHWNILEEAVFQSLEQSLDGSETADCLSRTVAPVATP
jgi:hypothetical protein